MKLVIRVPATTANLGPGYDCLGLALNLFNEFRVQPKDKGPHRITGSGACAGITGADNIFFQAFQRIYRLAKLKPPALDVVIRGRVPVARGLGSSSTAIVAGAMAAHVLLGSPLEEEQLLLPMAQIEGHPDNVAPALLGALTASAFDGQNILTRVYAPHPSWRLAMLIPNDELLTEKARAAIPRSVPHGDAVFNLARVPMVIDALTHGVEHELRYALEDRLHEPYRKRLIRGYAAIKKAALEAGAAAVYLSGAGPTMAAFCKGKAKADRVAEAMLNSVQGTQPAAKAAVLKPHLGGATMRIQK